MLMDSDTRSRPFKEMLSVAAGCDGENIYNYAFDRCFYSIFNNNCSKYVTLEHKTSGESLGFICSNSQQYTVWAKIIDFSFMPKIIRY